MNQPLLPPQLIESVLPEQVISILRGSIQLHITNIIRLEAARNYTRFVLKDGRKLLTSRNISFYEPLLTENFVRVHKSHLLNRCYITTISKLQIQMQDGFVVKVARRKRNVTKRTIS